MKIASDEKFIKNVERTISPAEISNLYFFQAFKRLLPRTFFKNLLKKTSRKTPYMGFVIDPYCLFLFHKVKDIERAKTFLPERYELKKSRIFADDEPDYYYGFGCFNVRASTLWGTRLESYLIAEDKETGHMTFIFIDILSNTIIALPSVGIADPNSENSIFTTSSKGDLYLDIKENGTGRQVELTGNVKKGKMRKLDQPLWLFGNTSIAHSKDFTDDEDNPFAVIFDPAEVKEAMDIPLDDIHLKTDTLFPGLAESEPSTVVCFPFSQHYLADSPGCMTHVKNRDEMIEKYNAIAAMKEIRTFSAGTVKKLFFLGTFLSGIASLVLLVLLVSGLLSGL